MSAAGLDVGRLRKGVILGVNDAALPVDDEAEPRIRCDAFFTGDHNYAASIKDKILAFAGERHLCIKSPHQNKFRWPNVTVWNRRFSDIPSFDEGVLSSGDDRGAGSSGLIAINLAVQMGARRVVIFGLDMRAEDYRYWFNGRSFNRARCPAAVDLYARAAPHYERLGFRILNANPASAVEAFPKITHEEAYAL